MVFTDIPWPRCHTRIELKMPNIPLYMAGQVGIVKDIKPNELTPLAWTDGKNINFRDGRIVRGNGNVQTLGTPSAAPRWIFPVPATDQAFWVYSSATALFATDGAIHADVSRTVGGAYTVDDRVLWNGAMLANIPIITNFIDVPQAWLDPNLVNNFQNLPNWPADDRCRAIKPFKQIMVALNINRIGTGFFPHMVKWSHPAEPGAVPTTWDAADPTKLAGEVELVDGSAGEIREGLELRDTFIIYKDNTTWGMQFIGGNSVFRFFPIFNQSGILSTHCVQPINNGAMHFVATGDDVIVHDGQGARSVLSRKLRTYIRNTIASVNSERSFCVSKPRSKEVWFCFPQAGDTFPSIAVVYNYEDDTSTIKDLPSNTNFAATGTLGDTSDPWDEDSGTWDSDAEVWDELAFASHFSEIVSANEVMTQLIHLDNPQTYTTSYVERTGLALIGQDRLTNEFKADNETRKLVKRIWPKAEGAAFNVRIGTQETMEDAIVWLPTQMFTPGVDKYLDFLGSGRFITVRFENHIDHALPWEISGYDLEIDVLSNL